MLLSKSCFAQVLLKLPASTEFFLYNFGYTQERIANGKQT